MGHEKAHVTEQILEGVTAISPAGFVAGLLTGTEKDKLENAGLIILLLLSLTVFGSGIYLGGGCAWLAHAWLWHWFWRLIWRNSCGFS